MEFTFFRFDKQLVLEETLQYLANMLNVCLFISGKNLNIVQVDKYKPVQHITENIIH